MNDRNIDIAKDNWVGSWPRVLRWATFLPLAILGSMLLSVLFLLIVSLSTSIEPGTLDGGWYRVVQSILIGGLFVYIGAYIAPRHQFAVGIVMLVLITFILTFLYTFSMYAGTGSSWYLLLHLLASLVGGGGALYGIYGEVNSKQGGTQWRK
jgi:hypothetical protein